MGYLTTITIHNDAQHAFEEHPEEFAKALFDGIRQAERDYKAADVGFRNYGGYIEVQHPRHADDHTVYVHCGNCVVNVNPYEQEFKDLMNRCPEFVAKLELVMKHTLQEVKRLRAEMKKKG